MRSNWSRAVGQALFKSFRQSTQIPCASSVVLSSAWHLGQRMAACCMLAWVHLFLSCGPFPSFMRKHMFRQPGQYFRRSRSNDFSWRRWIFWRGAGCLHHYFLQVGDVATDHWASLEAYQTNQKLMKSCWDASQKLHAFCFVSVEVQMSQTLSNRCFWNLFSNFRTLMKVFTNSVVNFVVARIPLQMRWSKVCVSFTHSKLAWFFSSTPNTPLSRIVHVTGKNLSIGGAQCVENCNCVGRIPTSLYPRWTYTIGANVQCYQPVSSVSKCRAQPTLKSQMSCIMICISVFMFECWYMFGYIFDFVLTVQTACNIAMFVTCKRFHCHINTNCSWFTTVFFGACNQSATACDSNNCSDCFRGHQMASCFSPKSWKWNMGWSKIHFIDKRVWYIWLLYFFWTTIVGARVTSCVAKTFLFAW